MAIWADVCSSLPLSEGGGQLSLMSVSKAALAMPGPEKAQPLLRTPLEQLLELLPPKVAKQALAVRAQRR